MRPSIWLAIWTSIVFAAATACAGPTPPRPRNLLIVTLDTTRADRLPPYGFASIDMPAIERLAREGVVFSRAMSVAPLTLPAHASLFTGLYPPHHGIRDNAAAALASDHQTLATRLQAHGFRTGAFVGSTVLSADRGLAAGFDTYSDGTISGSKPTRRRPANAVADEAIAWLDGMDSSPFLLWVHFYDAHAPQAVPEAFRRRYGDGG